MSAASSLVKRLIVVAALLVAVTLCVLAARSLTGPLRIAPPSASLPPRSIVWANRVFSSRSALTSWLAGNGASYEAWAKHHPAEAAILEHVHGSAFTPPRQKTTAVSRGSKPASPQATSPSGSALAWARIGVLVVATLLMLVALIPADLVPLLVSNWLNTTRRTYVFALGLALCVGVLIAGI
jgi:hypothetical protein